MRTSLSDAFPGLSHLLAALFVNCGDFRRSGGQASTRSESGGLEGRWKGEWRSETNGHGGELKCVITGAGSNRCRASFRAVYWSVLRACYTVELTFERRGGGYRFKGESNLGRLAGGVYSYEGEVTGDDFLSDYRCRYDHGTFRMKRVA